MAEPVEQTPPPGGGGGKIMGVPRTTAFLVGAFLIATIGLVWYSRRQAQKKDQQAAQQQQTQPVGGTSSGAGVCYDVQGNETPCPADVGPTIAALQTEIMDLQQRAPVPGPPGTTGPPGGPGPPGPTGPPGQSGITHQFVTYSNITWDEVARREGVFPTADGGNSGAELYAFNLLPGKHKAENYPDLAKNYPKIGAHPKFQVAVPFHGRQVDLPGIGVVTS